VLLFNRKLNILYCVLWKLTHAGSVSLWMTTLDGNLYIYPDYIQWFYLAYVQILILETQSLKAWNGFIFPRAGFSGCLPSTW